ncbi:hypothetical protein [Helicobacter sp. 13S00482-2]|nr:hypothetical protein [Helicobacter sp. 13S00482-2]
MKSKLMATIAMARKLMAGTVRQKPGISNDNLYTINGVPTL